MNTRVLQAIETQMWPKGKGMPMIAVQRFVPRSHTGRIRTLA
jgi:hypothetical protein